MDKLKAPSSELASIPEDFGRSRPASRTDTRPTSSLSIRSDHDTSGNVRVYARFRPLQADEQVNTDLSTHPIEITGPSSCSVANLGPNSSLGHSSNGSISSVSSFYGANTSMSGGGTGNYAHEFSFDRVFAPHESQEQVFECCFRDTIQDIMLGYNCAVLAYGQTGAGKSYTMMGPSVRGVERGAIPRIVESLFGELAQHHEVTDFVVSFSCMEIYNEKVKDLLKPERENLPVREHQPPQRGFYVQDLSAEPVNTAEQVYALMERSTKHRAVAQTQMNPLSSRSHSIVQLRVAQTNKLSNETLVGTLSLVDLAGSEKVSKTGAVGQVLTEAKNINRSLSALGMVIQALTDTRSNSHVPYRESKLTRILQESLGGNARTSLVVNCSFSEYNLPETLSTLRFGTRAKRVRNKPVVNTAFTGNIPMLMEQLTNLQAQHEMACAELQRWRSGALAASPTISEPDLVSEPSLLALQAANHELELRNARIGAQIESDTKLLLAQDQSCEALGIELHLQNCLVSKLEIELATVCESIKPKLAFVSSVTSQNLNGQKK